VRRFGRLFQIETEAVDPAVPESLVIDAITDASWFDPELWDSSKEQERTDIERLRVLGASA
jgi:hypothetical protein